MVSVLTFFMTMLAMPILIRNLKIRGVLVRDYYKRKKTYIPREGGLILLFACGLMITIFPLIIYFTRRFLAIFDLSFVNNPYLLDFNYFIVLSILVFGLFGMMDDYIDVGRPLKVLLPMLFITPIIFTLDPNFIWIPFIGELDMNFTIVNGITFRGLYRFIIIPVYIIVVSNLINMHSGFNGLQTGLSSIILITLLIKAMFYEGTTQDLVAIGGLTGAIVALWFFNKYPAQIFEGNTGSLMIGAGIGLIIIIKGYHFAGFIMLIPHTINFLMYVYWRIKHKLSPKDPRYKLVKFGSLRKDGTLRVPNQLTLKWYLPYKFRMTEKEAVLTMYGLTILFCAIGFFVPG
jgi:UDP-N-acetylglucosamine--dolichyl-phosphate N-acetylglucosaminephosphotransferase